MSMNINELQTLNDHLNAMQKAMETLAGIEERLKKLEEMHEAKIKPVCYVTDHDYIVSDDVLKSTGQSIADLDARSEWSKARDEVWKLYPEAFSQPTPRGHAVYTKLYHLGGHKIADGKDREDAWIKAAGVVLAQVESTKPQPIDYESLAATNGDSIQPASPRDTRTEWEIARDVVLVKYPNAECHQIIGGYDISTAIMEGKNRVRTCFHGEGPTRADAWIRAAKNIERDGDDKVLPIEPVQSIWSREIPSESGWYWWRRDSGMLPQFCLVDKRDRFLLIGPLSGSRSISQLAYHDDVEHCQAEFGPKIPDAETLTALIKDQADYRALCHRM